MAVFGRSRSRSGAARRPPSPLSGCPKPHEDAATDRVAQEPREGPLERVGVVQHVVGVRAPFPALGDALASPGPQRRVTLRLAQKKEGDPPPRNPQGPAPKKEGDHPFGQPPLLRLTRVKVNEKEGQDLVNLNGYG